MFPVWRYLAPAIDVFCPDIYVPYFCNVCDSFTRDQNPLLIPESAAHSYAGARLVYTIGHYHAMGFSPFGFEDMGAPVPLMQGFLFGMDDSDPALKTMQDIDEYAAYAGNLQSLMPLILPRYGTEELQAVCAERKDEAVMNFGEFCVSAVMDVPFLSRRNGVALGIKTSEDSCYLLVNQCVLQVTSNDPERPNLDYLDLEEGYLEDGNWVMTRRLNGDESTMMLFTEVTLLRMRVLVFSD